MVMRLARLALTGSLLAIPVLGSAGCDVIDRFQCITDHASNDDPSAACKPNTWVQLAGQRVGDQVFSVFPVYPGSP